MSTEASAPVTARRTPHLALDLTLLAAALLVVLRVYAWIDPGELRAGSVFPWDAGVYRLVADALPHWSLSDPIIAAYPWGPRLLFPAVYGSLGRLTGVGDFQAAYLVEVAAIVVVSLASFALWRVSGISRTLAWAGIALFALAWAGPLRSAGLFPGAGFGFQLLTVWMVFAAVILVRRDAWWRLALACLLVLLAALSREFASYILAILVLLAIAARLAVGHRQGRLGGPLLSSVTHQLAGRRLWRLILLLLVSLSGYVLAHVIVQDPASTDNPLRTAVSYGYFHLNAMELLYPFVYGLGPFAILIALVLTFRGTRAALSRRLRAKVAELDIVLAMVVCGVLFALFAGTDSDRFLLWMFPFFGLIALTAAAVLWEIGGRRVGAVLLALLAVGLLWTRFYVPAIPHLFFPGDHYCATAGVRTDYDPDLYFGPPFMASMRNPLITVPADPDHKAPAGAHGTRATAQIPSGCVPAWTTAIPDAYAKDVNNLPFPLGFAHNQYELLVAHPYHGDWRVRAALFAQWVLVYLALAAVLRPPLRRRSAPAEPAEDDDGAR